MPSSHELSVADPGFYVVGMGGAANSRRVYPYTKD